MDDTGKAIDAPLTTLLSPRMFTVCGTDTDYLFSDMTRDAVAP